METRAELVTELIRNAGASEELRLKLGRFPWDCEENLAVLDEGDIRRVLAQYATGVLSAPAVAAWAESIECRDDVGYSDGDSGALAEVIFWLANPEINGPLDAALLRRVAVRLALVHG